MYSVTWLVLCILFLAVWPFISGDSEKQKRQQNIFFVVAVALIVLNIRVIPRAIGTMLVKSDAAIYYKVGWIDVHLKHTICNDVNAIFCRVWRAEIWVDGEFRGFAIFDTEAASLFPK